MLNKLSSKRIVSIVISIFIIYSIIPIETFAIEPQVNNIDSTKLVEQSKSTSLSEISSDVIDLIDLDANENAKEISLDSYDDPYSVTIKNDDGSCTLYSFGIPIKYTDENGEITFKSNKLVSSEKEISLSNEYTYENEENDIKTYFPEKINDGILMEYDDVKLSFKPANTVESSVHIVEDSENENVDYAEYDGIFGEGTKLQYTPTFTGIKENIVLEKYTGINTFEFLFNVEKYVPYHYEGITIPFIDPETNEVAFVIGQVDAKDSFEGEEGYGEEYGALHYSLQNTLSIKEVGESQYLLTIEIDKEFLERETTVYPVVADPTISIPKGDIQNTWAAEYLMTGPNYTTNYSYVGTETTLRKCISFVKTTGIQKYNYIRPENVTSAYYHAYASMGGTTIVEVYDTASTWNANTLTWSNKPSQAAFQCSVLVDFEGWYSFSITNLFKQWLKKSINEGGWSQDFGFMMAANSSLYNACKAFSTVNNNITIPYMAITYNEETISDGIYYIKNVQTGKYLDADGSENYNVIAWPYHGDSNQQWKVQYQGNGLYRLYNMRPSYNGYALDCATTYETSNAGLYAVSGSWLNYRIVRNGSAVNGDGTHRIMATYGGHYRALGVSNTGATAIDAFFSPYQGTNSQKWVFELIKDVNILTFYDTSFSQTFGSNSTSVLKGMIEDASYPYIRRWKYNFVPTPQYAYPIPADSPSNLKCEDGVLLHWCSYENYYFIRDRYVLGTYYKMKTVLHTFPGCWGGLGQVGGNTSIVLIQNYPDKTSKGYIGNIRRIQHEIGHNFGLGHSGSNGTYCTGPCIMNSGFDENPNYNISTIFCSRCEAMFQSNKF